ncbi:hypothetical protein [Streptomyces sp. NPDC001068]|uniref:hypothetical protein n=1 Tax=Streptomyces sp. NPDC001068 TaxID=3364544 RepID=UPI0036C62B68
MSRHSRTKPNRHDRQARHAGFDALLPRLKRGKLTPEEAALLAAYVLEERRLGEKTRRSLTATTRTLAAHREAADAAIREAEETNEAHRVAVAEALGAPADTPWSALVGRAHDAQHWAGRARRDVGETEQLRERLRQSEEARATLRGRLAEAVRGGRLRVECLTTGDPVALGRAVADIVRRAPQHLG